MSAPTLSKAHEFRANVSIAATGAVLTTNRNALLEWKGAWTATTGYVNASNGATTPSGSTMWAVRYSCNSTTAGTAGDLVDRWSSASDLVWNNAGIAHSWMVLRSTALGTAVELLISCEGSTASGHLLTVYLSPSANFSGGSTTARPTATDEQALLNNAAWGASAQADASLKMTTIKSTDGESWALLIHKGGITVTFVLIQKAVAHDSTWTNPVIGLMLGNTTEVITVNNLNTTASVKAYGASSMTMFMTMPFANSASCISQQTTPASLSSAWNFNGITLVSYTAANVNTTGAPLNIWWTSTTNPTGSGFPNTGTANQFWQSGCLAFPGCQTALQVS
jgi:hypothetical protein